LVLSVLLGRRIEPEAARFLVDFGGEDDAVSLASELRVPPSAMQWPPPWKTSAGVEPGGGLPRRISSA